MCLRVRRGKVGLAFLKMLDLARRVLRAHEAAMEAAHLITFGRRVLVLKFGLVVGRQYASRMLPDGINGVSYKGAPYVWIGVSPHGEGLLLRTLALRGAG